MAVWVRIAASAALSETTSNFRPGKVGGSAPLLPCDPSLPLLLFAAFSLRKSYEIQSWDETAIWGVFIAP
jgi:hypothetical protein